MRLRCWHWATSRSIASTVLHAIDASTWGRDRNRANELRALGWWGYAIASICSLAAACFLRSQHKVPNYIVDIVYVFLFFALMLVAVFLAFLSGFLVADINTLYDSVRVCLGTRNLNSSSLRSGHCLPPVLPVLILTSRHRLPLPFPSRSNPP